MERANRFSKNEKKKKINLFQNNSRPQTQTHPHSHPHRNLETHHPSISREESIYLGEDFGDVAFIIGTSQDLEREYSRRVPSDPSEVR